MHLFKSNPKDKKKIEDHIDFMLSKHITPDLKEDIVLPPPKSQICSGEIEIGSVSYLKRNLYPFSLSLKEINRHAFIAGSTGSGKTTLAKHIIRNLHARNIPFLIIDWEKSYRNLTGEFSNVEVITVGNEDINPLYLNPFVLPPGISKEEYIKSLLAIIAEDYLSGAGSDTVLMECMQKAYEECEVPTFEDLKSACQKKIKASARGRSMLWAETVGRIIAFLSVGAIGTVLNSGIHYPLDQLFTKNIVLELGGIKSPRDRKFVIHLILNWLNIWTAYHGIESEQLNQVILFEEFHNVCLKTSEDNVVSNLFREARKYGIGLVAIDQTPSEISNDIMANTNVKVSFGLRTNQDIKSMANAINMPFHSSNYFSMLETGEGIVHVGQRSPDPFVVKVPLHEKDRLDINISDGTLAEKMKPFSELNRSKLANSGLSGLSQGSQQIDTSPPHIQGLDKVFVSDIVERPLDGIDQRTKRLGLHPEIITGIHQKLTKQGIINPVVVDGKKLLEITDLGKEIAIESGVKIKKSSGRGGVIHTYWQDQTAQSLRNLHVQPVLEFQDIDLVDPDYGLAIEIETGKSDIKKNLQKLMMSGFVNIFMLGTDKQAEFKIKQIAKNYPMLKIMTCKEFCKLSKKEIFRRQLPE